MGKGKHYVILAFLKEKNIDYIYHPSKDLVSIPCINCGLKIEMNLVTTNWSCNCGETGNLITLIKYTEEHVLKSKIYNPKREDEKIRKLFTHLIISTDGNTQEKIKALLNLVTQLISHYENNTLQE